MRARKQSSTTIPIMFFMADVADHTTGKTGLVPVVTISKNGAAFGSAAGTVAEVGNGWYSLAGNATDRNTVGELAVHAAVAGADPFDGLVLIAPLDPTDGIAFGMTALPAAAFQAAGGLDTDTVQTGTATAGGASTITIAAAGAAAFDNAYNGMMVKIQGGTGAQQSRTIIGYIASTKVITVDRAWATNPDNTSVYTICVRQGAALNASLQPVAASVAGAVGSVAGNVVGSVGSLAAQAQTDVESALTAQGLTTARAAKLDDLDAAITTRATPADVLAQSEAALTAQGYTTTRAPFLDELGATNIPADVDTLLTRVDVATSTRLATSGYTAPDNADIATILTDVAAILARVDVTLSTRLAATDYTAPDNADIVTVLTDVGTLLTRIDVTLSTRLASVDYTAPDNAGVAGIKVVTDALPAFPADPASNSHVDSEIGTQTSFLGGTIADTQSALVAEIDTRLATSAYTAPPTTAQIADEVWDEPGADHITAGTMGEGLNAAGASADPLSNPVPGSYSPGSAGYDIAAMKTKLDSLNVSTAITIASPIDPVTGNATIVRGDAYKSTTPKGPLVWTNTDGLWLPYIGLTSVFTAISADGKATISAPAVITHVSGDICTITVELESDTTESITNKQLVDDFLADVQSEIGPGTYDTPLSLTLTILPDVSPPGD